MRLTILSPPKKVTAILKTITLLKSLSNQVKYPTVNEEGISKELKT